jgi:cbb3-type cytochrome oxidase subunit 3
MKSEILTQTDHLIFPLVAAVLFVSIFLGAVWRVLRPGARQAFAQRAAIVFDDSAVAGPQAGEEV